MNKTIKILFAASLALALFSCKKDESIVSNGSSVEYWANGKTLVVFINPTDTTTIPTIDEKNNKANVVISDKSNGAELVLNDVLTGYRSLALKCNLSGSSLTVDTVSFWDGGRRVAVNGYVDGNVLTLKITDIHAESFTDKKWMLGEVIDESDIVKSWGYDSVGQKMPAVYLNCSIDTLYVPVVFSMVEGLQMKDYYKNHLGSCAIPVDSILGSIQSLARVAFSTSDLQAFFKALQQIKDKEVPATKGGQGKDDAPKLEGGLSVAMIDYIEFTSAGKFGIGLNDHHAEAFFKEAKRENVYKQLDSIYNYYSASGSPITELVDAQNPHCILNYYEGLGKYTGQPMLFVSTGVFGGTVIDVLNSALYYLESTLHIDEETINIPIRLFESSPDKLVLGIAVNEVLGLLDTLANNIDKCTYEQFNTEYFPHLNYLFHWMCNTEEGIYVMNMVWGMIFKQQPESGNDGSRVSATSSSEQPSSEVPKTWEEAIIQYGLRDFQINEDMFNIVKPLLSNLLRVVAAFKTVDLSIEIEFMPYENCRRPWEYVPKL